MHLYQGTFVDAPAQDELRVRKDHYLLVEEGVIKAVFHNVPEEYATLPVTTLPGAFCIPGLVDLHLHASQLALCGINMDLELLPWLQSYVFPEEARFSSQEYADQLYAHFTNALLKSPTTRACIFATIHSNATLLLMEKLERSGLITYVGKVNMNQNAIPELEEDNHAVQDTRDFIEAAVEKYQRTLPIITPRFVPSCTKELLSALGELAEEYDLPVQSHISENKREIAWVKDLFPQASCYGAVYESFGLFGGKRKTVMAHAVHCTQPEIDLIRERGVYLAHCADSNINLASGIAPIQRYLKEGIRVGIGTDIAGGSQLPVFRAVCDAIRVSKLLAERKDDASLVVTFPEAFHAATKTGGSFFGKVGIFDEGYEFDALSINDDTLITGSPGTFEQRVERLFYLGNNEAIVSKFVGGKQLFKS